MLVVFVSESVNIKWLFTRWYLMPFLFQVKYDIAKHCELHGRKFNWKTKFPLFWS